LHNSFKFFFFFYNCENLNPYRDVTLQSTHIPHILLHFSHGYVEILLLNKNIDCTPCLIHKTWKILRYMTWPYPNNYQTIIYFQSHATCHFNIQSNNNLTKKKNNCSLFLILTFFNLFGYIVLETWHQWPWTQSFPMLQFPTTLNSHLEAQQICHVTRFLVIRRDLHQLLFQQLEMYLLMALFILLLVLLELLLLELHFLSFSLVKTRKHHHRRYFHFHGFIFSFQS